jgi:uncharacterized protein YabN with tetrapyrrole methylase and pyrophosphatase domain
MPGDQASLDSVGIYLVGLGLRRDQITAQAKSAMRSSKKVFYISHAPDVAPLLKNFCPEAIDLVPSAYSEIQDRFHTYKEIAATIIAAAMAEPPVTFALYGHPLVLSQPSSLILGLASDLQIRVSILPGISAMDCVFADLGIDPLQHGIQMHEATDLLLYQRPLVPDMATLIWQVGHVETRLHTNRSSRPERLTRLQEYLIKYYEPSHMIFAVASSVSPEQGPQISQMPLIKLSDHAPLLHAGTSLYIPPLLARRIADEELHQQLLEAGHLAKITDDFQDEA